MFVKNILKPSAISLVSEVDEGRRFIGDSGNFLLLERDYFILLLGIKNNFYLFFMFRNNKMLKTSVRLLSKNKVCDNLTYWARYMDVT